jgi:hypothetical protein
LRAIARKLIEMAEGALHLAFVIGGGGGVHAYASLPWQQCQWSGP